MLSRICSCHVNKNLTDTEEIWDHGLLKGDTQRKLLIRKCRRSSLIFLRKLILRKRCFLVVTYPNLNCLSKIIRDNLHLLYMNCQVKKVFSLKPMISFRSAKKLSSYIVRDKLYPTERAVGSFKCIYQKALWNK